MSISPSYSWLASSSYPEPFRDEFYAYMVRLLSDIERRLAGSGSSSRVGR